MIKLRESIGLDQDQTRDPWICSQMHICSQPRYRLRYAAWLTFIESGHENKWKVQQFLRS